MNAFHLAHKKNHKDHNNQRSKKKKQWAVSSTKQPILLKPLNLKINL